MAVTLPRSEDLVSLGLSLLILLALLWWPFRQILLEKFDPFDPINLVILVMFSDFVLRVPVVLYSEEFIASSYGLILHAHSLHGPLALTLVAVVAMLAGYVAEGFSKPVAAWLPQVPVTTSYRTARRIFVLLLVVGWVSFHIQVVQLAGGWAEYIVKFMYFRGSLAGSIRPDVENQNVVAIMGLLRSIPMFLVGWGYLFIIRSRLSSFWKALYWINFAVLCFLNFITGFRSSFITPFLAILICRHYFVARVSGKVIAVFALLVLAISLIMTYNRSSLYGLEEVSLGDLMMGSLVPFLLLEGIWIAFESFPQNVEFLLGRSIFYAFTYYIPRSIWESKPTYGGGADYILDIINEMPASGTHYSISAHGEFYANFGILGVIVGMFLFGVVLRILYLYACQGGAAGVFIYSSAFLSIAVYLEMGSSVAGGHLATIVIQGIMLMAISRGGIMGARIRGKPHPAAAMP